MKDGKAVKEFNRVYGILVDTLAPKKFVVETGSGVSGNEKRYIGNFENTRLLFPTISLVNFIYSKVLITKKEYVKVVALYEKSIAMAKIFPNLICEVFENIHIAIAYDNLSKRKDAVEKLEKALEIALSDRLYMILRKIILI